MSLQFADSNSHSSGTFVGVVVGSSEYEKGTPASPPPSRRGVILNAKWNKEIFTYISTNEKEQF